MRRSSMRFKQEKDARNAWWLAMQTTMPLSPEFAEVLAEFPQVLKGYGDTQLRGRQSYERIWNDFVQPVLEGKKDIHTSAKIFKDAVQKALADPEGQLNLSPREQTIQWFEKVPA